MREENEMIYKMNLVPVSNRKNFIIDTFTQTKKN
jgi:hypothetical protein